MMRRIASAVGGIWLAALPSPGVAVASDPVVLAAGDIASCKATGDEQTAALLDARPGTILALGDLAYPDGSTREFSECYGPSWGRHKARSYPTPGNHDYKTAGAAPYFAYFGAVAGRPDQGWYSFDLGGWHIVSLNSNCREVGGCKQSSPQGRWLEADLAAHPARCTLAFWHHPRFSSGAKHGPARQMAPFWDLLQQHGADLILSGHEHLYERFGPQNASGQADPAGIRQFTVGTGGRSLRGFATPQPNSEARSAAAYGVLALTLHEASYDWEFVPVAGAHYADRGSASCVPAPRAAPAR